MDPQQKSTPGGDLQEGSENQNAGSQQAGEYFDGDDEQVDLMDADGDMASSDSELQVKDPSQQMNEDDVNEDQKAKDPMSQYLKKQEQIISWLESHPGHKWVDSQFPCNTSQFYEDVANLPSWVGDLKNLQWKRPDQIIKDPKFMIIQQDKQGKTIQIDAKHGLFGESWFIGALTIAGTKPHIIQKLIIQKEYFDRGFVAFQFFKNGAWTQVVVDTLLPYEKQHNTRTCLYSSCANPQQFWIQLIQKAYVKLHKCYQRICQGSIIEGLVDLTGGVSQSISLIPKQQQNIDPNAIWSNLWTFYQQKFLIGSINSVEGKDIKNAEQGQQGILQNHYYTIIDMRDFPKDNLRLVRIRNPWGNQGVWTGAFCQQADDWQKYKAVKQQLKNVIKTKKVDGSWWMSFTDFMQQFDKVFIGKIFPQSWEMYSIEGQWHGKTNGGKCPTNIIGQKATFFETKQFKQQKQFIQIQSDDRWFNNPQYRIKVTKDTKLYISLMQQDLKITGQPYVPVSFMIATTKSKVERIWERPPETDIIAEVNANGAISNSRELTYFLTLKKHQGKQKIPKIYMIIPNIVDTKQTGKKDDIRKFYLRLLSPQSLDVSQLPETIETTVQGQWTQATAGGSRKIQIKQDGMGKKKGDIKDNPNWCKNPQYFLSLTQPTMLKIILRKTGTKKFKGWKIGLTICRYQGCEQKPLEKMEKKDKNVGNLQRLLQQTSQFLEPPVLSQLERKLIIQTNQQYKQSIYFSEDVTALFFKWNPTQGPFVLIPSSDGEDRCFGYKLTIFSNNPVSLSRLDDANNQVMIGRWEKDISAGGCHLNELEKEASQRTWSLNPKYQLTFKQDDLGEEPVKVKITLTIAEKNWKKLNPNTVNGMIGLYLLQRPEGKLSYNKDIVVNQTNFLPVKQIVMETVLGGEGQKPIKKDGYIIMPSTYQSKVQGSFIISVKCDRSFELSPYK